MRRSLIAMRRSLIVVAALVVTSSLLAGQAPTSGGDPINGTWKPNLAKSTYSPGPPPPATATDVRSFSAMEGGWNVFVLAGVNAQGDPTIQVVTFKIDGKQYPVYNAATLAALSATGKPTNVTRSYRRIDPMTVEFTTYTDGVAALPAIRTVSKDGKTYTQTTKGKNAQGQVVNNVLVFERVH